jgi:hypothetical protein
MFPMDYEVDSRLRGNDCARDRACLGNDTSIKRNNRQKLLHQQEAPIRFSEKKEGTAK